jgi:hypothetical protein
MPPAIFIRLIEANAVVGMLDSGYFISTDGNLSNQFFQKSGFSGAGFTDDRYNRGH